MANVTATNPRIELSATGGQVQFSWDFLVLDAQDLTVLYIPISTGITQELADPTDFSIDGGSLENEAGGTISLDAGVFPTGAAAGDIVIIYRDTEITRQATFTTGGYFPATTVEREETDEYLIMQENKRDIARKLGLRDDSTVDPANLYLPDPDDGKALVWDGVDGQLRNSVVVVDSLTGGGGGGAVVTVFGRNGVVVAQPGDYSADQITYDNSGSGLTATDVQAAIDELDVAVDTLISSPPSAPVDSVFGRTGVVAAVLNDYAASLVDNDSGVAGATVAAALDTLNAVLGGAPIGFRIFTSGGTYNPTVGTSKIFLIGTAGGGGGGGQTVGQVGVTGGSTIFEYTGGNLIADGGVGGGPGGNGGSNIPSPGGLGGLASAPPGPSIVGITGGDGHGGFRESTTELLAVAGNGGASLWGGGGRANGGGPGLGRAFGSGGAGIGIAGAVFPGNVASGGGGAGGTFLGLLTSGFSGVNFTVGAGGGGTNGGAGGKNGVLVILEFS